jgi:UDPglucose--hexose-1-phosphate uridylyltransferase
MIENDFPHRRRNPLTGEWVLVSPHRARRPWLGQVEKVPGNVLPQYDPDCYLCPGNSRAEGKRNDAYTSTYVFDNDFPALLPPRKEESPNLDRSIRAPEALFEAQAESGICRVVCFSPRHDLTLPELSTVEVEQVLYTWMEQSRQLGALESIAYVQVFENKGEMMGCSNPHPHSQIWATSRVPNEPATEAIHQQEYLHTHGACLLCDYLIVEQNSGERMVAENDEFSALVPFWAVWPFEILMLPRRHISGFGDLLPREVSAMADIMRQITARYDNLFEIPFPYSMGFHQIPVDGQEYPGWHFHAHYYPPLLRSASVRKFMVGYEMLSMPQRDLTPETAASRLRSLSEVHYKCQK